MIRVNLLKARLSEGNFEAVLARPKGGFSSGREVLVGLGLLVIGCVFLVFQVEEIERQAGLAKAEPHKAQESQQQSAASPVSFDPAIQPPASDFESLNRTSPDEEKASDSAAAEPPQQTQDTASRSEPTSKLTKLFVSSDDDSLRIFAATGSQPQYKSFRLENPKRVVVDLPDTVALLPRDMREQPLPHPQVKRIRAAQYQQQPPVTRIVLDVHEFPEVEFLPQFNGLYIRVGGTLE